MSSASASVAALGPERRLMARDWIWGDSQLNGICKKTDKYVALSCMYVHTWVNIPITYILSSMSLSLYPDDLVDNQLVDKHISLE
jgi:hypothetical protein